MKKPLIAVMGAHRIISPGNNISVRLNYANDSYCLAVLKAGGIPLIVPVQEDIEDILSCTDGILIPGGDDVDPFMYNEDPLPCVGNLNVVADIMCKKAIEHALKHNKPLLGICRGMQITNVVLGGSLYQDLSIYNANHQLHVQKHDRDYLTHKVIIEEGTIIHKLLGSSELFTNTLHHQSVKKIGDGLIVTSRTNDGIIESLENEDGTIMLVQYHPEELLESQPVMINLFKHFIDKSQENRN